MSPFSRRARLDDVCRLTVEIPVDSSGKPRTEMRLFKAGINTTDRGEFLFDDAAAASVMAAYRAHKVRVAVDLEHLSVAAELVTGDARNFDPDSRGDGDLDVRDGELWLVNIIWGPDGERRIVSRAQRYLSPFFKFSKDGSRRILRIYNVALTAQPATDDAMPIAASTHAARNEGSMTDNVAHLASIKQLQAVAKALEIDPNGDVGEIVAAVKDLVASFDQPSPAEKKEAPKPKAEEKPAEEPKPAPEPAEAEAAAAMRAGLDEMQTLRAETATLRGKLDELQRERDERVAADYHERAADLVKLGGLTPARAWADPTAEHPSKPSKIVLAQSIDELDGWIAELRANPATRLPVPQPPTGKKGEHGLTSEQLAICAETKCDPQTFAALAARFGKQSA